MCADTEPTCHFCKRNSLPQYQATLPEGNILNFCSSQCVTKFQVGTLLSFQIRRHKYGSFFTKIKTQLHFYKGHKVHHVPLLCSAQYFFDIVEWKHPCVPISLHKMLFYLNDSQRCGNKTQTCNKKTDFLETTQNIVVDICKSITSVIQPGGLSWYINNQEGYRRALDMFDVIKSFLILFMWCLLLQNATLQTATNGQTALSTTNNTVQLKCNYCRAAFSLKPETLEWEVRISSPNSHTDITGRLSDIFFLHK